MDKIMKEGINVLSLFDGISCGQIALQRAGVIVNNYFASEIDKHAIKVTQHNWPETKQLGSVIGVKAKNLPKIDLLIGGSPCQSFSFIGRKNGMSTVDKQDILSLDHYLQLKFQNYQFDGYSYLFWEYIRILKELNPKYFLLENVKMHKKWEKIISETLGVEAIKINSNLVSAQNRDRLYWTNIPFNKNIEDKKIKALDIREIQDDFIHASTIGKKQGKKYIRFNNGKMPVLTTFCGSPNGLGRPFWSKEESWVDHPFDYSKVRRLTPIEAERLQTVHDNYTSVISDSKRYHALGNGWTVDVIAHIFSSLPREFKNG